MTERKIIKGDAVFENFRRYLADQVTVAINSGVKIGRDNEDHCPIGCLPGLRYKYSKPNGGMARLNNTIVNRLPNMAPVEFMSGFDGGFFSSLEHIRPYYELGKLYRERFIERKQNEA